MTNKYEDYINDITNAIEAFSENRDLFYDFLDNEEIKHHFFDPRISMAIIDSQNPTLIYAYQVRKFPIYNEVLQKIKDDKMLKLLAKYPHYIVYQDYQHFITYYYNKNN